MSLKSSWKTLNLETKIVKISELSPKINMYTFAISLYGVKLENTWAPLNSHKISIQFKKSKGKNAFSHKVKLLSPHLTSLLLLYVEMGVLLPAHSWIPPSFKHLIIQIRYEISYTRNCTLSVDWQGAVASVLKRV